MIEFSISSRTFPTLVTSDDSDDGEFPHHQIVVRKHPLLQIISGKVAGLRLVGLVATLKQDVTSEILTTITTRDQLIRYAATTAFDGLFVLFHKREYVEFITTYRTPVPVYWMITRTADPNQQKIAGSWSLARLRKVNNVPIDSRKLQQLNGTTDSVPHCFFRDVQCFDALTITRINVSSGKYVVEHISVQPIWCRYRIDNMDLQHAHALTQKMMRTELDDIVAIGDMIYLELSGGHDSSSVLAMLDQYRPITAVTASFTGAGKQTQIARIEKYKSSCPALRTMYVDADKYLPFSSSYRANTPFPGEEVYYNLADQLMKLARMHGCTNILTGFGGDELFRLPAESTGEGSASDDILGSLRQSAPQAVDRVKGLLPASIQSAMRSRARIYWENGIWPIHVLSNIRLFSTFMMIPTTFRTNRLLQRRMIETHLLKGRALAIGKSENFTDLMVRGVQQNVDYILSLLKEDLPLWSICDVRGVYAFIDKACSKAGRFIDTDPAPLVLAAASCICERSIGVDGD